MKPIVRMDIPKPEDVTKQDVCDYLNEIMARYGPPCDWCKHFDVICDKGLRTRQYSLELGPYGHFTIRKQCDQFEGEDIDSDEDERRTARNRLSCDAQTYGG